MAFSTTDNRVKILTAVSESPVLATPTTTTPTTTTPVTSGMPVTFSINADGSGGEFHVDVSSKLEKRKSRPARPPPPLRRPSHKGEQTNGNEAVDGLRQRMASGANLDSGPPDSISCTQFACTFTKKNGMVFTCYFIYN